MTKKIKKTKEQKAEEQQQKERKKAKCFMSPEIQAAQTFNVFSPEDKATQSYEIVKELIDYSGQVKDNDLNRVERMLIMQAETLNQLFHMQIRCGRQEERFDHYKLHMDLGYKAQRQCCKTLEVLAEIKNPQPYIRQQNMAYNQQVNNGKQEGQPPAHAEKLKSTNELLECENEQQQLDTRATATPIRNDEAMATMETKHRPQNT